jgi:hypothetical protein
LFFFLLTAPLALSAFALLFNYNLLLLVQIYVDLCPNERRI